MKVIVLLCHHVEGRYDDEETTTSVVGVYKTHADALKALANAVLVVDEEGTITFPTDNYQLVESFFHGA